MGCERQEGERKYVDFHDAWLAIQPLGDGGGSGGKTAGTTRKHDSEYAAYWPKMMVRDTNMGVSKIWKFFGRSHLVEILGGELVP